MSFKEFYDLNKNRNDIIISEGVEEIFYYMLAGGAFAGIYAAWKKMSNSNKQYGVKAYNKLKDFIKKIRRTEKIQIDNEVVNLKNVEEKSLKNINDPDLKEIKDAIDNYDLSRAKELRKEMKKELNLNKKSIIFYIFKVYSGKPAVQVKNISSETFQLVKSFYGQQYAKFISDEMAKFSEKIIDQVIE